MSYKIISYYTQGTPYEEVMKTHLIPSLEKYNLPNYIRPVKDFGNWQKNTHYKALFIKECLLEFNEPVVFLDSDATILQYPKLFDGKLDDYDIGLHFLDWYLLWRKKSGDKREALSGTLFINNTDKSIKFLNKWIRKNEESTQWEQRNMEEVLKESDLNIYELPYSYITIKMRDGKVAEHMIKSEDVVIKHHQASRKFKNRRNW